MVVTCLTLSSASLQLRIPLNLKSGGRNFSSSASFEHLYIWGVVMVTTCTGGGVVMVTTCTGGGVVMVTTSTGGGVVMVTTSCPDVYD